MNTVPIIRKGSIKDYWSNGLVGGILIGGIVFLISIMDTRFPLALLNGLIAFIAIIFLFIGVGFLSEEYFLRKRKIKTLSSKKYDFLDANNFRLHQDLYFEGWYNGFWFRIIPTEFPKSRGEVWVYEVIEAYYQISADEQETEKIEEYLTGNYFLGEIYFSNHRAAFIPRDWQNPDLKENLDGLVSIFKSEKLEPLSKTTWEATWGQKLIEESLKDEQSRTKQIIKFWKLDIKYIKQKS